jgi:hypothetical protein
MVKYVKLSIVAMLLFALTACGTLLKDTRGGPPAGGGKLDTKIVLLDAIGLLFVLVPGIVAFAIDYSNGTLYE